MADTTYWASLEDVALGEKLVARVKNYGEAQLTRSLNERLYRAFQYYYGFDPSGVHATSQILRGGDVGELAEIRVNHSRSLVNTLLNLIVAPKVVWQPKATNIDYDSLRETELVSAILEYYWTEKQVAKHAVRALEEALVFSEGFVLVEWDGEVGEPYSATPEAFEAATAEPVDPDAPVDPAAPPPGPMDPNAQSLLRAGDVRVCNIPIWDVIRDSTKASWDQIDWVIVRQYRNKWDVAAEYPDHRETVLKASDSRLEKQGVKREADKVETDDIPIYYFFHKSSAALPDGRRAVFLEDKTVLEVGELGLSELPLYRVAAGELTGTPYGYTPYWDILGVQELMDSLHTSIASNQSTLATQTIAIQEGSETPIDQLAGGLKAIYYPPGAQPPQALQLLKTPQEVFGHLQNLKKEQELLLGLSSVVRGEAQSGEMSGSALALLQSQALQQSSTIQSNYLRFIEGIGSCVVATLQKEASIPRQVSIVGKTNQFLVRDQEFTSENISRVKRVQVEIGNPLSQTGAGRIEMAKDVIQMMGPKLTIEQYNTVLQTGRLEPMTQALSHELLLIKSENEALARGEVVPALALDDHMLHAREHKAVLANPEARKNKPIIQAVTNHILEHEQLYYGTAPTTLALVGQPPPMQPPMDPNAPPPPGGEGDPGLGGGPATDGPPGGAPQMPELPQNPATGQQWDATTGGGAVPSK